MSYSIAFIASFERAAKKLSKKYPSFKKDLEEVSQKLREEPEQGVELGNNCYKVRMAIKSKGKGKSGGGRLILCLRIEHQTIYFLTVYDKSDKETITDKELEHFLEQIPYIITRAIPPDETQHNDNPNI